jgi:uncharacterized protein YkwD
MLTGSTARALRLRRRAPTALIGVLAAVLGASPALAKSHHHRRHHHRRHHRRHATRACDNANTPVGATSREATKTAVVCLINKQRTARGLPALRESGLLDRSAQAWTDTMVSTGSFTHGANFAGRISATGFAWSSAGENIATGFLTPWGVVNAWMGSTGHCQNILNPTYTNVGTGVVHRVVGVRGNGATWTQDFALTARRRAPSHNFAPADGCPY